MEMVLRENDYKGGWVDCSPTWLLAKLLEEIGELGQEINEGMDSASDTIFLPLGGVHTKKECADIANIVMMIASKC